MSTNLLSPDQQIQLAMHYFNKVDAGDTRLLDLFTDDTLVYFPKYGIARGKGEFATLLQDLSSVVSRFVHDYETMLFTQAGIRLVVEGTVLGSMADGTPWPTGNCSAGNYCSVFEFRGKLISRMFVYRDPDFAGRHTDLFPMWP